MDGNEAVKCKVNLVDGEGVIKVFQQTGCEGVLLVPNATLWWPIFMDPNPGHLYLFEVISFFRFPLIIIFYIKIFQIEPLGFNNL